MFDLFLITVAHRAQLNRDILHHYLDPAPQIGQFLAPTNKELMIPIMVDADEVQVVIKERSTGATDFGIAGVGQIVCVFIDFAVVVHNICFGFATRVLNYVNLLCEVGGNIWHRV